MRGSRDSADPNLWTGATLRLLRWVDPKRRAELLMHIEDATAAGDPLGPGDAASVLGMATQSQLSRLLGEIRFVMIGLPVALLCAMVYGAIYESHFAPWDLMEETRSSDPTVALIRQLVDLAWIVVIPLGLLTGWLVVKSVSSRRYLLPAIYLLSLLVLFSQSDIFIERTNWIGDGLQANDVDEVSAYSLGLLSMVFVLPLTFVAIDLLSRRWKRSSTADGQPDRSGTEQAVDPLALGAVLAPFLVVIVPLIPLALFLVLVLAAPSFRFRHKIAAAATIVAPAAAIALTWETDGIDDPGLGALLFLVAFVAVWIWLAAVTAVHEYEDVGTVM